MTKSRSNNPYPRLLSLGLSKTEVKSLLSTIEGWKASNGEEWTVSRLKDLKTDYLRWRSGQPPLSKSWISRRKDGRPRGLFGRLFEKCEGRTLARTLYVLNYYASFTSNQVTKQQLEKFTTSVLAAPPLAVMQVEGYHGRLRKRNWSSVKTICDLPWSDSRRAPKPGGGSIPENTGLATQLTFFRDTSIGYRLLDTYGQVQDAIPERILEKVWSGGLANFRSHFPLGDGTVGSISLLQEPGFKLRAVANPNRILQVALKPLGDQLYEFLSNSTWDCTFSQEKGIRWVQDRLRERTVVHSIDLSDATNHFPLNLQLSILRHLGAEELDLKLFEDVSRLPWSFRGGNLSWTKGQPLGLYPSFASFAVSHGVSMLILGAGEDDFRILGDDIVISNSELALRYRSFLSSMDCPISENKSLVSDSIAEFAGHVITRESAVRGYKWRTPQDDSFMDHLRVLGPSYLPYLSTQQRRVAKFLGDIPEALGGFGWNPKGLSLDDRLRGKSILIDRIISEDPDLMPYGQSEALARRLLSELSDGYEYSSRKPSNHVLIPTRDSEDSLGTKARILRLSGVTTEVFSGSETIPLGWVPKVKRSSDPRRSTTLSSWIDIIDRQVK